MWRMRNSRCLPGTFRGFTTHIPHLSNVLECPFEFAHHKSVEHEYHRNRKALELQFSTSIQAIAVRFKIVVIVMYCVHWEYDITR